MPVALPSGDVLLHNSFMGAIARIPKRKTGLVLGCLTDGIDDARSDQSEISELCQQGFFVDAEVDERKTVEELLEREREESDFDLMLLLHENCNFRCRYCYEYFQRGRMTPNVVKGLKKLVSRKMGEYPALTVSWFGGEPLLAPEVIRELSESFAAACRRHDAVYRSSITTNGYLLSGPMVDMLLEHEVFSYQVTLDGPRSLHNRNRKLASGGGTYDRILYNLVEMTRRVDDFRVRIRVNLMPDSKKLVDEWLSKVIAPRFSDDSRFEVSFHVVGKWGGRNDSELNVCKQSETAATYAAYYEKPGTLGIGDGPNRQLLTSHGWVCYASKRSALIIGADGVVYKCSVAFADERNKVGQVGADGHLQIDNERWKLWTDISSKDLTSCQICWLYPTCQSRKCPLTTLDQSKPPCPMTREMYESLVRSVATGTMPAPQN
jgi:uncharacterized protein